MPQIGEEIRKEGIKEPYTWRACPVCRNKRWVRKWSNKSGICRVCASRRSHPQKQLQPNFKRGEELGKAPQTIYFWQECPQCYKPRWKRANLGGVIEPNRLCWKCAGFNAKKSGKRLGEHNGHWRGGRHRISSGYIKIYNPNHPKAVHRQVFEHLLVWERTHNKPLPQGWISHHINGIKDDNRPENHVAIKPKHHSTGTLREAMQRRIRELEKAQELVDYNCIEDE